MIKHGLPPSDGVGHSDHQRLAPAGDRVCGLASRVALHPLVQIADPILHEAARLEVPRPAAKAPPRAERAALHAEHGLGPGFVHVGAVICACGEQVADGLEQLGPAGVDRQRVPGFAFESIARRRSAMRCRSIKRPSRRVASRIAAAETSAGGRLCTTRFMC